MSVNLKARIKRSFMAAVSGRAAWLGVGSFALSLASAAAPGSAHACSGFACFPGTFYLAPETVLPANTVALRWRPPNDANANSDAVAPVPHVTRVDGTSEEEQMIEVVELTPYGDKVIRILKGFVPGARYRLWAEGDAECLEAPVEIVTGPEAPLPKQLGRTVIADPTHGDVTVPTISGSCDTPIPAVSVGVDLELAAETKPWAALLMYTVRVDAEPWSYARSLVSDAGTDAPDEANTTVYAQCAGEREDGQPLDPGAEIGDLKTGTHQVVFEASLPDVVTVLYTDPVEIMLECESAADPDSGTLDGARDAGADAGSSARHDAGKGDNDGRNNGGGDAGAGAGSSTHPDTSAGGDAGHTSGAASRASNSGDCTVHAAGAGRSAASSLSWLLCALALSPVRARLRRRISR